MRLSFNVGGKTAHPTALHAMETVTARSTKDEILTAATEAIDYHTNRADELARQRIALWVAVGILATILSLR